MTSRRKPRSVRIEDELWDAAQEKARREDKDLAVVVRALLAAWIKRP